MPLAPSPDPRAVPLQVIAPADARRLARRAGCGDPDLGAGRGLRGRRRRGSGRCRRRTARSPARWSAGARRDGGATASRSPPPRRSCRPATYALRPAGVDLDAAHRGARLADGRLPLRPLPRRPSRAARALVCPEGVDAGADRADRRGGAAGAGPDQHAGARHGAGGAGGGLRRARGPARRRGCGSRAARRRSGRRTCR